MNMAIEDRRVDAARCPATNALPQLFELYKSTSTTTGASASQLCLVREVHASKLVDNHRHFCTSCVVGRQRERERGEEKGTNSCCASAVHQLLFQEGPLLLLSNKCKIHGVLPRGLSR